MTYDRVKLVTVRSGSAVLLSDFGEHPINLEDAVLLAANAKYGAEPEGRATITTIYLDPDYAIDQFYWQHTGLILDRLEAQDIAETVFSEPAQFLRIGEQRLEILAPWLDELVELSEPERALESFARMQALWFLIADMLRPFIKVISVEEMLSKWVKNHPESLRGRRFEPVRPEARAIRETLRSNISSQWTLEELRGLVHLSTKQAARVFARAYGKTPSVYLIMLRVEEMARRLRETNETITAIGRLVGWRSRSRATDAFHGLLGMAPREYRNRYARIGRASLAARRPLATETTGALRR